MSLKRSTQKTRKQEKMQTQIVSKLDNQQTSVNLRIQDLVVKEKATCVTEFLSGSVHTSGH